MVSESFLEISPLVIFVFYQMAVKRELMTLKVPYRPSCSLGARKRRYFSFGVPQKTSVEEPFWGQVEFHDISPQMLGFSMPIPLTFFLWWLSRLKICQECRRHRRHRFNPWVRKISWRRKWQPTLVYGQRSLVVYSPWGCKEAALTEQLRTHLPWLFLLSFPELSSVMYN